MATAESSEKPAAARADSNPKPGWVAAMPWLVLAALLLIFANGRHTIAAAAWLAPVFLLRFLRVRRAWVGLPVAWVVLSVAFAFQFRGMAPLPGIWFYVLALIFGSVNSLPYVVDRLVVPRVGGFAATFVFPCGWVATEYLVTSLTPYGSWGSMAYTQHENLALLQVVSVTGIYGVTFLIAWFASMCNWVWERGFSRAEVRGGGLAFSAVVAALAIFGGARLVLFAPTAPTVRVASITRPDIDLFPSPEVARRAFTGTATEEDLEGIRHRAAQINNDLLNKSEREARAGAQIVFWGETNAYVFKEDEPSLMERGAELAREYAIYVGVAVGTWNRESAKPLENKIVLFDPRGDAVWENWKAIPVPGPEAAISALDDGLIKSAETPLGEVAGVVCFDMDFPGLLKQAGRLNTDLMLVPSNDWKEIDPWHSHMARFRAVEQGFNMVRHVSNGLSLSADYQGRVLTTMDHFTSDDRVLVSHVPTRGVRTVYSRIGDTFAWLCVIGLCVCIVRAWRGGSIPR